MICNLNIRHNYLNIKINNQGKILHVWSLTTDSNKDSHQYTKNSNLSFYSKNDFFHNLEIIVILNLNIRHTYLNIKINNQGKTLHVWSLTTDSNKDSHQYTKNFKLKLFFQKWYFYNLEIIVICNLNIRHTYLNIKINNQGKILHVWSLTTDSNKDSHQYTDNSNLSFSSKNDTLRNLEIIVICNLNIRHTYLNIKINNQGKTLHVWSLTTESNKDSHQYTKNSNLSFSSKNDTFTIWRSLWLAI